jgi:hypothetical protein
VTSAANRKRAADVDLIEEIDALKAKLEARLDELVEEEKLQNPALPMGVLRNLLLHGLGPSSFFAAMRQVLVECVQAIDLKETA